MEALARKEAGVDDSLVLETLLGNLRSGGGTPKTKRKARERGAARRAKESLGGAGSPTAPGLDGVEEAVSGEPGGMAASPPRSKDPSELAQAMLAKLQGGGAASSGNGAAGESEGDTAGSTTSPTPREKYARRRERRATSSAGGRRSTIEDSAASGVPGRAVTPTMPPASAPAARTSLLGAGGAGNGSHDSSAGTTSNDTASTASTPLALQAGSDEDDEDQTATQTRFHSDLLSAPAATSMAKQPSMSSSSGDFEDADEGRSEQGGEAISSSSPPYHSTSSGAVASAADTSQHSLGIVDWIDPDSSGFGRQTEEE